MKTYRLVIAILATFFPVFIHGQLLHPLGLSPEMGERQGDFSQPRMHIENDRLYVCTNKGLYSKDLSNTNGIWKLVGFKDIPLQDYARRGNDILALRYNKGGNFLLLSHDDGPTYEDITPDIFRSEKYETIPCLAQHPTDPNTLLVPSLYKGIFRSTDFGQTWENLTEYLYGNRAALFVGFHPTQPSIIYNSGEGDILDGHINISYDAGKTWNNHGESLGFPGDNCVHRLAFHPTSPECWIAGGEGVVYTTNDNGYTWSCQDYWNDEKRSAYWYFTVFDYGNPEIVYMAGFTLGDVDVIKVMCSTDGGKSWGIPYIELGKKTPRELVNDLEQYGDKLLIYTESDVYEVSKSELIEQTTSIQKITSAKENTTTYDLQGRKMEGGVMKGITIKNGKKTLHR